MMKKDDSLSEVGPSDISVALVEDDLWLCNYLSQELTGIQGIQCVGAFLSGEDAVSLIPGLSPDVVIMDINLPGMSGVDCLQQLKRTMPELNVLMLTAFEEGDLVFASLRSGANGYLLKRSSIEELVDAIQLVHCGGSPMTGVVARKVVSFFQAQSRDPALEQLSKREREILGLLAEGDAYKSIAGQLNLSIDTVRMHIRGIYRKLQVHSRGEAVARLISARNP